MTNISGIVQALLRVSLAIRPLDLDHLEKLLQDKNRLVSRTLSSTYTDQMQIATIRLHHYLLEKDLDPTMVKSDVVEADKEIVIGDNQLDHGLRTTMKITVTTILIDPKVEQGVQG